MLIEGRVKEAEFLIAQALLFDEQVMLFQRESVEHIDKDLECKYLLSLKDKSYQEVKKIMGEISSYLKNFSYQLQEARKESLALEFINVSGKMEANRLTDPSMIVTLLSELQDFNRLLKENLKYIDSAMKGIYLNYSEINEMALA